MRHVRAHDQHHQRRLERKPAGRETPSQAKYFSITRSVIRAAFQMRPSCIPNDGLPSGDRLTPPTAREVIPERPYGHVHHPANLPICVALPPQFYDIGDIRIEIPCIRMILTDYPARIVHCRHHPDCSHGQASRLFSSAALFYEWQIGHFLCPTACTPGPSCGPSRASRARLTASSADCSSCA